MTEDWGADASAQPFTLFKYSTPEEEAQKDTFVDTIVYNKWKKSERRLYGRLVSERIARQIETEKLKTMDDLTNALKSLDMLKTVTKEDNNSMIDDLIGRVEQMKLNAEGNHSNTKDCLRS